MYCSNCAAVLDANQPFCSRCGRATERVAAIVEARPSSVTIASVLLAVSILVSLLSSLGIFITPSLLSRLPASYWAQTIGFQILWILLVILFWQRQGWTRIAMVALIVWTAGNIGVGFLRNASFGFLVPFLIVAVRLIAVFFMFRPESNAWFKKR